jgi:hypothetical protein
MSIGFSQGKSTLFTGHSDTGMKLEVASTLGDGYGLIVDGNAVLSGAGATGPRRWVVGILADKTAGIITTGGCDDALLRIVGNNYVANETVAGNHTSVYNFRGINVSVNNRSGGVVAELDNIISIQGKSGGYVASAIGCQIHAENYGTVQGVFGGLDVNVQNEAAVATLEYGIQIRNTNNSITGPVATLFNVLKSGVNTGFTYFLKLDAAATLGVVSATSTTITHKIPILIGSTPYWIAVTAAV